MLICIMSYIVHVIHLYRFGQLAACLCQLYAWLLQFYREDVGDIFPENVGLSEIYGVTSQKTALFKFHEHNLYRSLLY